MEGGDNVRYDTTQHECWPYDIWFYFWYHRVYRSIIDKGTPQERPGRFDWNFCSKCFAAMWVHDPERWVMFIIVKPTVQRLPSRPDLVMACVSVIDSELTDPEEIVRIALHRAYSIERPIDHR